MFSSLIYHTTTVDDNIAEQNLHFNRRARLYKFNHLQNNRRKVHTLAHSQNERKVVFARKNFLTFNLKGTFIRQKTCSSKVSRLARCLCLKEDECLIHSPPAKLV